LLHLPPDKDPAGRNCHSSSSSSSEKNEVVSSQRILSVHCTRNLQKSSITWGMVVALLVANHVWSRGQLTEYDNDNNASAKCKLLKCGQVEACFATHYQLTHSIFHIPQQSNNLTTVNRHMYTRQSTQPSHPP